jgi:TRAP-type C4-dicarboxylate transport system permease small subunit
VIEPNVPYVRNRSWKAKLEFHLTRIEGTVAVAGLALLLGLSLAEIGARNFFHTAIPGADILNQHLVLWVSFLGAVQTVRERYIKIDAATVWLSRIWQRRLERPIFVFSAVVCANLFWAATRFWREEWLNAAAGEKWITALGINIPLSFLLLTVHFTLRFLIGPRSPLRAP